MGIVLLLVSCIVVYIMLVFCKTLFQRNSDEMSSNEASPPLVRSASPSGSNRSVIDKSISVTSLSQDILNNIPHSVDMQKRILVNLRLVEYKLTELELFLIYKGLNGTIINKRSTVKITQCYESEENH